MMLDGPSHFITNLNNRYSTMSHMRFKGNVLNYHSPFHVQNAHILVSIFTDQGCNDSCDEIRVLFSLKNVSQ